AVMTPKALGAATLAVTRAGARLVAVGERGVVLLSDDNGASWRQARVPVQTSLTTVRFVDARLGWAAGHLGVILRTEDGGESWTVQMDGVRAAALQADALAAGDERAREAAGRWIQEGPDKPFFDIEFLDARHGFAVGAFNLALATIDGGKTWMSVSARLPNAKAAHLYGIRRHGSSLYVVGEQGLVLTSSDSGSTFQQLPSPYKGSFFGLLLSRTGTLVVYGLRGTAFRSTDHGASWQKVDTGISVAISAGTELDDGRLVLLTQEGDKLLSSDDGAAFKRIQAAAAVPAAGMAATTDGALVVASLRGMRRQPAP
ncbi:MAG TPA: YCF48-related protein, partial [Burkholderiaceae bacterium]|nr:YCF48-related protein [Burkholderiaceae bacterium]